MIVAELEFPFPFAIRERKTDAEIGRYHAAGAVQSRQRRAVDVQLPTVRPGRVLRAVADQADVPAKTAIPRPADRLVVIQLAAQPAFLVAGQVVLEHQPVGQDLPGPRRGPGGTQRVRQCGRRPNAGHGFVQRRRCRDDQRLWPRRVGPRHVGSRRGAGLDHCRIARLEHRQRHSRGLCKARCCQHGPAKPAQQHYRNSSAFHTHCHLHQVSLRGRKSTDGRR